MIDLPEVLVDRIEKQLQEIGDQTGIQTVQTITGGCIHLACQVQTGSEKYMLKWNQEAKPGMFSTEKAGLDLLRRTSTVRVPFVYAAEESDQEQPAFILMEWISSHSYKPFNQRVLGEQ